MQGLRGFINALVVALISAGLIIGALSISLVEFVPQSVSIATNILLESPAPITATLTLPATIAPTIGRESPTPIFTPTLTNTILPPPACHPPFGWGQIIIQAADTLENIAARYRVSKDDLRRANCLLSDILVANTILYAPSAVTSTPAACDQGEVGWVKTYVVKAGETLYGIASNHYTSVELLKAVNCRVSELILVGEILWVPNVATRTPLPQTLPVVVKSVTAYPTEPLTLTVLPFTATIISTNTLLPFTLTPAIPAP